MNNHYRIDVSNPVPCEDDKVLRSGTAAFYLIPSMKDLPLEFQRDKDPWCEVVSNWFFRGLKKERLKAKPGIDINKALRHCAAILQDFGPAHEHKIAAVSFLMSRWFEPYKG